MSEATTSYRTTGDLAYPSWFKGFDTSLAKTCDEASRAFVVLSATEDIDTEITTEWAYTMMLLSERVAKLERQAARQDYRPKRHIPQWLWNVATIVSLVAIWVTLARMGVR